MNSSVKALAAAAIAALVLAGCAALPRPADDPGMVWSDRQARLEQLFEWSLSGRVAVRTDSDGGQARVSWQQDGPHYDIRLRGPFGSGTVRLAGGQGQARLWLEDGSVVEAADPEALLYRHTGWWIPVEALRYWVLGLPAPRLSAEYRLDDWGRLSTLRQAGWSVSFEQYGDQDGLQLPNRLTVESGNARVRLVVSSWELDTDPALQTAGSGSGG